MWASRFVLREEVLYKEFSHFDTNIKSNFSNNSNLRKRRHCTSQVITFNAKTLQDKIPVRKNGTKISIWINKITPVKSQKIKYDLDRTIQT
jgi:hypothetical protein